MRKFRLTGVLPVLMAVMMVFFAGCGKDDEAADPNLGMYVAKSAEMSGISIGVEDIFEGGFTFELKKKGKATVTFGDESGNVKWTLEGDRFHAEGEGAVFDGTVSDGVMVLENVMDSGVTLTLECDEIKASAGKDKASDGKGDEKEQSGEDSLYGRYEAISAEDSNGEVWIEEGEYLIVNDDDTVSMYVAEQNLEFDTTIRDNKFYLDGDTKVGDINPDGSITLNMSDEVKYTFAKKGSELWEDWLAVQGESGALDAGDFGAVDITGGSGEDVQADYDFDEALKLVGDYEGIMIFKEGAHCYGRSFDGITGDAFARIVIDEKKQPLVYMRHIYGESVNIEHVKGEFREDGWLTLTGVMGTDDGPLEWTTIVKPPVGSEPICLTAVLTSDYETPLFDFYMKPLGSKWNYGDLDGEITEKDFKAYVNNMGASDTGLLEDDLQVMQDFWSANSKMDDPIKMITDELPDPKLLDLYK